MRLLLPALALALLATGCKNSCQRVCDRMARYAEDECGLFVSPEELGCCHAAQAGSGSRGDRSTCRQFGGLSDIESTWSCNDLEDYGPFAGGPCDGAGDDEVSDSATD